MSLSISVVTPCLDQASFLPAAIESVRNQTRPALEHVVYDPGSTDGSRSIADAAESVRLVAEADSGQSAAVTRGFAEARGDIVAWLNADDRYGDERVFERVLRRFEADDAPDVVYGRGRYVGPDGEPLGDAFVFDNPRELVWRLKTGVGMLQPAVFLRRRAFDAVGGLDEQLQFAMDYDLWIRLVADGARFRFLNDHLAHAVVHGDAKTQSMRGESIQEAIDVARRHFGFVAWTWALRQADWELTGRSGLTSGSGAVAGADALTARRAQRLFDGYNRNPATVRRLLWPPWDRPTLATLKHLVRRAS